MYRKAWVIVEGEHEILDAFYLDIPPIELVEYRNSRLKFNSRIAGPFTVWEPRLNHDMLWMFRGDYSERLGKWLRLIA